MNSKTLQKYISFQTNLKKYLWGQIVHSLQETRIRHKLDVRKFDDDLSRIESAQELSKFIRYFMETLLHVGKQEIVYMMQACPLNQQQEIAAFMQNDYEEMSSFQDITQNEYHTTSTIISLEENLTKQENQLKQHLRTIESMKSEFENQILDYKNKIIELADINEKLADQEYFFLQKLNCADFEEAWSKFEYFTKELNTNKQKIDDLNQIVNDQEREIDKMKQKYERKKTLWESNPPTARTVEIEQVLVKDQKEQKTIEMLKQQIQAIKEENQRVLGVKQSQYECEVTKLTRKLYEAEQEISSLNKKMHRQKLELEEMQSTKEPERKNNFESLRHQGIISQGNSMIVDFFGQSPKSVVCGDMFEKNKLDLDHGPFFHAQSQKGTDDNKLQQLLAEKTNKILLLEKQIQHYQQIQQSGHSRRSSMSKFNSIQPEKQYFDSALLEVLIQVILEFKILCLIFLIKGKRNQGNKRIIKLQFCKVDLMCNKVK